MPVAWDRDHALHGPAKDTDDIVSHSKIEGSVDAIAQRIYIDPPPHPERSRAVRRMKGRRVSPWRRSKKAKLMNVDTNDSWDVLFNPKEYSVQKSVRMGPHKAPGSTLRSTSSPAGTGGAQDV